MHVDLHGEGISLESHLQYVDRSVGEGLSLLLWVKVHEYGLVPVFNRYCFKQFLC